MKEKIILFVCWLSLGQVFAQSRVDTNQVQGAWALKEIVDGDTLFNMVLPQIRVTARWNIRDTAQRKQYDYYKYCARKVYPYAAQALDLYYQMQAETAEMEGKERKKYMKKEHKDLKDDFKNQLKDLSKTQGKVLIKMIERQLNKPFYALIEETRGSWTAFYWNGISKLWGYDLKAGYQEGEDVLLDAALLDYDFSPKLYEHWRG